MMQNSIMKISDDPQSAIGKFHVIHGLGQVRIVNRLYRFYFEDDIVEQHKIRIKPLLKHNLLIYNAIGLLPLKRNASEGKFVFQGLFIHTFKQTAPKGIMHLKTGSNNLV